MKQAKERDDECVLGKAREREMGFRVSGLGFRVPDLGFGVQGSGLRFQG